MYFIWYPRCTTCQKAKKWLDDNNITYSQRHIADEKLSYEEIKEIFKKSDLPLKKFFNTSGLVYKELNLKEKLPLLNEEEQLKLLASDGKLVKRPIVVTDDNVLVGFKEDDWSKTLL